MLHSVEFPAACYFFYSEADTNKVSMSGITEKNPRKYYYKNTSSIIVQYCLTYTVHEICPEWLLKY